MCARSASRHERAYTRFHQHQCWRQVLFLIVPTVVSPLLQGSISTTLSGSKHIHLRPHPRIADRQVRYRELRRQFRLYSCITSAVVNVILSLIDCASPFLDKGSNGGGECPCVDQKLSSLGTTESRSDCISPSYRYRRHSERLRPGSNSHCPKSLPFAGI